MIENACSMAVEFFVAKKKFRKALKYASKNSKLIKFVRSNWVVKLVEKFKFKKAMKVSKGNSELVKFINQSEYKWILEKLPHEFDEKLIIKFQSKIQRAYTLADRLGDKQNKKLLSKLIR